MNRTIVYGIALFVAVLGIALMGSQKLAVAGNASAPSCCAASAACTPAASHPCCCHRRCHPKSCCPAACARCAPRHALRAPRRLALRAPSGSEALLCSGCLRPCAPAAWRPACGCTSCCEVKSCCPRKCRCHHRRCCKCCCRHHRSCCVESCCSAPCCAPAACASVRSSGSEALLCSGCLRPGALRRLAPGLRLHLVLRGEELLPAEVPLPPPPVLQVLLPASQELLCRVLLLGALVARRLALRALRLRSPAVLRLPAPSCAPAACARLAAAPRAAR